MSMPEGAPPPKKKPRRSVAENLVFRTPFICILCFLIPANIVHYGIGGSLAHLVCLVLVFSIPIWAVAGLVACCRVGWEPTANAGLKIAIIFAITINVLSILIWIESIRPFCYF